MINFDSFSDELVKIAVPSPVKENLLQKSLSFMGLAPRGYTVSKWKQDRALNRAMSQYRKGKMSREEFQKASDSLVPTGAK